MLWHARSCCSGDILTCSLWRYRNQLSGGLVTDFCTFPGQDCTPDGTLRRLDLTAMALNCSLPVTALSAFRSLTTLNLGANPGLTVRPL
jgi:hypothetical protein